MNGTKVQIHIPPGVTIADLKLSRDPLTGDVEFDWSVLEAVAKANGLDPEVFADGQTASDFIFQWYSVHREDGGAPDRVQEQVMSELDAAESFGLERVQRGPLSLQ